MKPSLLLAMVSCHKHTHTKKLMQQLKHRWGHFPRLPTLEYQEDTSKTIEERVQGVSLLLISSPFLACEIRVTARISLNLSFMIWVMGDSQASGTCCESHTWHTKGRWSVFTVELSSMPSGVSSTPCLLSGLAWPPLSPSQVLPQPHSQASSQAHPAMCCSFPSTGCFLSADKEGSVPATHPSKPSTLYTRL